jgi:hypothetical protein
LLCKRSFQALREVQNQSLKHTIEDYKIAGALINKFHKRLISDGDCEEVADKMLETLNQPNELKQTINKLKLNRSNKYTQLRLAIIEDFPKLEYEDIKNDITLGSYQLNQALSYLAGHLNENGEYEVFINDKIESIKPFKILLSKIESRHVNKCEYNVYIKYLPNESSTKSIAGWFCTCKDGARTVGCCSHIACVIYYLSFGKYKDNLKKPAEFLNAIFPNSRAILLAEIEELVSSVIQNSDDIEDEFEMVSDDEYFNNDNNIINIYDNSDTNSEVGSWVDREISSDSDIENNDIDLIWDPNDPYDYLNSLDEETREKLLEKNRLYELNEVKKNILNKFS